MNQLELETIEKAKKVFLSHNWLNVTTNENIIWPYANSPLEFSVMFRHDNFNQKKFLIYIHENYISLRCRVDCPEKLRFEPVRFRIDPMIWVELYSIFSKKVTLEKTLVSDNDTEPI